MPRQTASLLFPSMVRSQIIEQHRQLRELLALAFDRTAQVLRQEGKDEEGLADLVRDVCDRFKRHLAFEERNLAPVLARIDTWGPERVQDLVEEHARQGAELDALIVAIDEQWDMDRVAFALRALAADLLLDMEEEEQGCLRTELLGDDVVMLQPCAD